MERRYGRKNEKYHAKLNTPSPKRSFEKLIVFQTVICAFLLVAGIVVSYADKGGMPSGYIKEVLYKSNSAKEWRGVFSLVLKTAKKSGIKIVKFIDDGRDFLNKKLDVSSKPDTTPIKANADKKDKPDKAENKKEDKKETEPEKEVLEKTEEIAKDPLVFRVPTMGEITSAYGTRLHPVAGASAFHTGIDIAAPMGQTIISAAKGQVITASSDSANGNYVVINHADGFVTSYAHMSEICVIPGEWVDDNTKIGEVGSSGVSTGPHLHFEIKLNGESQNPENYISLPHRKGV